MARDAMDAVCHELKVSAICKTERYLLAGADGFDLSFWKKLRTEFGFEEDVCQHLASKYGGRANSVTELCFENPALAERISPQLPFLKAEIVYSVRNEMALTIRDFMARRIRLEIMDWGAAQQAAPVVAKWMGDTLGWTVPEQKARTSEYVALLESFVAKSKFD